MADWMIGMSAGEPLIMPTLPCANCSHSGVRSTVPGLGSVSPAATMPLRKVKAATLAGLSMVYLPAGLVAAAVAEHPQQRLGLRLLVAEGEAEADVAQLGDLGGVGLDVGPGLRGGQ